MLVLLFFIPVTLLLMTCISLHFRAIVGSIWQIID